MRVDKEFDKPDYPGKFFGHCVTSYIRVPTGKKFPWYPPGADQPVWLPIKEGRVICSWTWDGANWLDPAQWETKWPSTPRRGSKSILVSKRGVTLGGHGSMAQRLRKRATLPAPPRRKR
tara:strand:+ start:367 stop:723 length:357 start_codon:yes stop_codon:yes gene_type:complete